MVKGSLVDIISGVARVWRTIPTPGAQIAKERKIVLQKFTNMAISFIEHEFGRKNSYDFKLSIDSPALEQKKKNVLK